MKQKRFAVRDAVHFLKAPYMPGLMGDKGFWEEKRDKYSTFLSENN